MFKLNDRIKEKTYSVGSGNLDFSGPTPAYSSFSSVYASGDTFFYCVTNDVDYEIGVGRFIPNKLQRTQVLKSSKPANAIVNWPVGLKEVYVTYPSENSVFQVNNVNSQNAPAPKNLSYWYDENALSDIEGLSFDSGRIVSDLEFHFSDVISFSGYNVTQDSPFRKDQLISSTAIDDVIYQSGEVNEYKGFKKQRSGSVFAGPLDNCGSGTCPSGYPVFRPLSAEDIPVIDAENVSYTPLDNDNWPLVPTNVEDALDILASNTSGPAPITWSSITGKPSTFPPTLPISSGSVSGMASLIDLVNTKASITSVDILASGKSNIGHTHVASDIVSGVFDYARIPVGNVANTVCSGNDPRLTNARTPLYHTHDWVDISGNIPINKFNFGSGALSTTFWRGDGTWASVATGSANWGSINGTLSSQADLVSALAGKSNTGHTHVTADITNLSSYTGLDVRYFTEGEITTLLSGKADLIHTHPISGIINLQSSLDNKSNVGHTHSLSDISQSFAVSGQTPVWNGSSWIPSTPINGVTAHSLLTGLSNDDHPQYLNATRGSGLFFGKSEVTSFLSGKANTSHTHDATDINTGVLSYARLPVGTTSNTICAGDDSRLSNSRNPLSHTHTFSEIIGNVPLSKFNNGFGASSSTFWRGDGSWQSVSGIINFTNTDPVFGKTLGISGSGGGQILFGSSLFLYNSPESLAVGYTNIITDGGHSSSLGFFNSSSGVNSHSIGVGVKSAPNTFEIGQGNFGITGPITFSTTRTATRYCNGFVATTINSNSRPIDGGTSMGLEPSGTLPREMYSVRRVGNALFIDINVGGTIRTLSLGTAS